MGEGKESFFYRVRKKGRNRNGAKKVDSKVGIARNAYVKGNFAFAYGYLTLGKKRQFSKTLCFPPAPFI